jgi:carbonic anhydrase/acetyltransferase-like protein (isoleucine patch superfamily)
MLYPLGGKRPQIGPRCYVAPGAHLIGEVILEDGASVWFNAVLRSDNRAVIRIGRRSNVQDGCVMHTENDMDTLIGEEVTIGHCAIVHAATVRDRSLIGMQAVVLDGAVVGPESFVAAGALVPPRMVVPPRTLVMGAPAKVIRELTDADLAMIRASAEDYFQRAQRFLSEDWAPRL